ncbi:hypothetical protein [Halegenticoccus tardaugens]|uniref:hypothetical protein n=1 Tax=Halegenticoccus tardaugens TaxID=2071624 RepID=UPI00100B50EE|nr:hypothetical protein [Halegenticoccus tardaugens]
MSDEPTSSEVAVGIGAWLCWTLLVVAILGPEIEAGGLVYTVALGVVSGFVVAIVSAAVARAVVGP